MKANALIPFVTTAAGIVLTIPAFAVTYLSIEEAQKVLFPDGNYTVRENIVFTPKNLIAIEKASGIKPKNKGQPIWRVYDQANEPRTFLGFFIFDAVIGKHELIDYAVALSPQGEVLGVEVLTYRESYGFEIRNKHWRKQFNGKKHGDALRLNQDIRNIGGATLSCRGVSEGVKKILGLYETLLR